jgi:SAM-dependent methyltransferase
MERWLLELLRCPLHHAGALAPVGSGTGLECRSCGAVYPVTDGIPVLLAPSNYPGVFREEEARQWDEQAAIYDEKRVDDLIYLAIVEAAVRSLAPRDGDVVLDAACGTGLTLQAYGGRCRRAVGLDLSLESLRRARAKLAGRPVAFVQGDLAALPLAPAAFDRVLCANALQSMPDDGLRRHCAAELARVARPGGRVVVTAHNLSALKRRQGWRKQGASGGVSGDVQYIYRFEAAEFRELFASVLKVRTLRGAGFPLPYRWKLSWACRLLERCLTHCDAAADWGHLLVATCTREETQPVVTPTAEGSAIDQVRDAEASRQCGQAQLA